MSRKSKQGEKNLRERYKKWYGIIRLMTHYEEYFELRWQDKAQIEAYRSHRDRSYYFDGWVNSSRSIKFDNIRRRLGIHGDIPF